MLAGRKIILGISGGIAAYKSLFLIRLLKKSGAEVKVVATQNALEFVTKVTLETLSQNKLYFDLFEKENDYTTEHIALTDWGELLVVAPATANVIGKFAHAIADDALSTTFLAFNKKVFLAPSMNTKMYANPALTDALELIKKRGISIIEPAEGMLACGYEGKGRMEEPEIIFNAIKQYFSNIQHFYRKKVLVSAGPTIEPIDPVRYISNHSSGLMGYAIANELSRQGAKVTLVSGPIQEPISLHTEIQKIRVSTASEMYTAVVELFPSFDLCIMTAAVADYTPKVISKEKMKKKSSSLALELLPTKDILLELGRIKKSNQILVGFALETENETQNAIQKLHNKNLDCIVLNTMKDEGAGFAKNTNKITIINKDETLISYPLKPKTEVAVDIVEFIYEKLMGKRNHKAKK